MMNNNTTGAVRLSVILPANNEAALIGGCLSAILDSDWDGLGLQVIVVANGCSDDTAARAQAMVEPFSDRGWQLDILDLPSGGKLGALNAGDATAKGAMRVYLDADVTVSRGLLWQLANALDSTAPRYASGAVTITAKGWVSRAYARIWRQVPFMAECVPGCGVFAVNAAGRARWETFPDIISDDTFVRLSFTPNERIGVAASYEWPIAEGWSNLVTVRRRQDVGVDEIGHKFPELLANDDKPDFGIGRKLGIALRDPIGFAVYSGVALTSKLTRKRSSGWSRGR
ncbi:glycosyltransferase [uncultured Pelagimonas sp.]|uniref:glycosyltransferase n=1 Tax=uncultured Pelagimonas sp. TaxID=1618102 RepID=UPI00261D8D87|nr:glycosyltransferase [uncultured Pelagimonas sp.]